MFQRDRIRVFASVLSCESASNWCFRYNLTLTLPLTEKVELPKTAFLFSIRRFTSIRERKLLITILFKTDFLLGGISILYPPECASGVHEWFQQWPEGNKYVKLMLYHFLFSTASTCGIAVTGLLWIVKRKRTFS